MKYKRIRNIVEANHRRTSAARLTMLAVPFGIFFAVVAVVAASHQIRRADEFRREASSNMRCAAPQPPVRADIIDRNGVVLAVDNSEFRVLKINKSCTWESIDSPIPRDIRNKLEFATGEERNEAVRKLRDMRFREVSRFAEQPEKAPDIYVDIAPARSYPQGMSASHIIGYLGEINQNEKKMLRHKGYRSGDRTGKSGIERWHETSLSGKRGGRLLLTDARGKPISELKIIRPEKPEPLRLTIDIELQKTAMEAFHKRKVRGAAVFMLPGGQVLAMVSSPSFSPAPGPDGLTPAHWAALSKDPARPLLNRAVSSNLPLGSVFKLVVAAAALEENAAAPRSTFFCRGYYPLPGRMSYPPKCHSVHGNIGFADAISQSCDVYFYILGQKLGVTKIKKYAKMMGLGSKTGIDIPGESVGLVPDEFWKKHFGGGGKWNAGDTINLSIGQGNMQVTPIQVARMVNVFASGGMLATPRIAEKAGAPPVKLPLKATTINTVRHGMRGAVTSGTARAIADFPMPVAAKTGTAQTGTRRNPKPPHAWFAGFAPYDSPRITFAVYVEHGGYGAAAALPIAKEVLAKALEMGYFN